MAFISRPSCVIVGHRVLLQFPYSATRVETVKTFPGYKWNPETQTWSVSATLGALPKLIEFITAIGLQPDEAALQAAVDFNPNKPWLIMRGTSQKFQLHCEKSPAMIELLHRLPGAAQLRESKDYTAYVTLETVPILQELCELIGVELPDLSWMMVQELRTDIPKPKLIGKTITKVQIRLDINNPVEEGLIALLKQTLPGASFDKGRRCYIVPVTPHNVNEVEEFAFLAGQPLDLSWVHQGTDSAISKSRAQTTDFRPNGLVGEPYPFQLAGIEFAVEHKTCIIGDDMGLGKSLQALGTIEHLQAFPTLIVCPASLKLNWAREVMKWLPHRTCQILKTKTKKEQRQETRILKASPDIFITNYESLAKFTDFLLDEDLKALVCDEAHYLKNWDAARTKQVHHIANIKNMPVRLMLTGTPILNQPGELISQLQIIGRMEQMGGAPFFRNHFMGASGKGGKNLEELSMRLRSTCLVRRLKGDVLTELPPKQRATIIVEISNRPEYQKVLDELFEWVWQRAYDDKKIREKKLADQGILIVDLDMRSEEEIEDAALKERIAGLKKQLDEDMRGWGDHKVVRAMMAEAMVKLQGLKRVVAEGKLHAAYDWIDSFLLSGKKLIVFAHHICIQEALWKRYQHCAIIKGGMKQDELEEGKHAFQSDPACNIIICSLEAGGVGHTLTAASDVLFLELGWTPAKHDQAEDRAHRIGQSDSVTAWYLLGEDTIDEQISKLIDGKRSMITQALEGTADDEDENVAAQLLTSLFEQAKGRRK